MKLFIAAIIVVLVVIGIISKIKGYHITRRIRDFINNHAPVVLFTCCIVLIAFFIITCASCLAYRQLTTNDITMLWCFKLLIFMRLLPADASKIEYISNNLYSLKDTIAYTMNLFVAVSGIAISFITGIAYIFKVFSLKNKAGIKRIEVYTSGVEDVKIMLDYFKNADSITVYAHTYQWVPNRDEMVDIFFSVAKKNRLKLITPNKENTAEHLNQIKDDEKKKLLIDSIVEHKGIEKEIRFSLVERDGARYLLYRHEESGDIGDDCVYVTIMRQNSGNRFQMELISLLLGSITDNGSGISNNNQ